MTKSKAKASAKYESFKAHAKMTISEVKSLARYGSFKACTKIINKVK